MIWDWRERVTPRYWDVVAAIVSAASLSYGVYSGEQSKGVQRRGLRRQEQAQQVAQIAASRQQKLAAEAYAAANRRKPDIGSILATEAELGQAGSSTTLTGPGGVRTPPGQPTRLLGE